MIKGKKILAIIPARGGSKGVLRKNIRELAGKPLIAWSIEEAKKSKYIDRLILSSDDAEIISVAKTWGCEVPFVRPSELAIDATPGMEPVFHAMEKVPGFDIIVLLQPTSPLRNVEDIDGTIERCLENDSNACVSLAEVEQSPFWMYTLAPNCEMKPIMEKDNNFVRRQDLPKVYTLNGAVYVAKSEWLLEKKSFVTEETLGYIMPQDRSLDIDTEFDLKLAELMIQKNYNKT
ncbi:MAG: acylneuraminate cytidylyltransferase family protein [Bacteriovorax sp.]|nr:acylneuraminate cytidylyltransferase family protein [Bacteriovorax sp.]